MSGGSYNYLCFKDAGDLLSGQNLDELNQMMKRLIELCPEAAKMTEDTIIIIKLSQIIVQSRIDLLREIWHDVEWKDSGDIGDDSLQKIIEEWRINL